MGGLALPSCHGRYGDPREYHFSETLERTCILLRPRLFTRCSSQMSSCGSASPTPSPLQRAQSTNMISLKTAATDAIGYAAVFLFLSTTVPLRSNIF
jgi:hypothetical protein